MLRTDHGLPALEVGTMARPSVVARVQCILRLTPMEPNPESAKFWTSVLGCIPRFSISSDRGIPKPMMKGLLEPILGYRRLITPPFHRQSLSRLLVPNIEFISSSRSQGCVRVFRQTPGDPWDG